MRPTPAPASLSSRYGEMEGVLNADIGGVEAVVHGRRTNACEAAQAAGALFMSSEVSEWNGVAEETRIEDRLGAEDWLDVAHALLG